MYSNKKNILVIIYSYIPDNNPRVFRWSLILEELEKRGHKITVLTASEDKNCNGISKTFQILRIRNPVVRKAINNKKDYINKNNNKISNLTATILKKIYWPDYAFGWILPASLYLFKLEKNSYDIVISISHPFSSHIVGFFSKKILKINKWIMDVGDPFAFQSEPPQNNIKFYENINKKFEKKLFNLCDKITVTINSLRLVYINEYNIDIDKIKVIGPIIRFKNINCDEKKQKKKSTINIIFVGTLYKNLRSPNKFLKIISKVGSLTNKKICIKFYGNINDCDINFSCIPKRDNISIEFLGLVSSDEVKSILQDADILLNIGNSSHLQIPSKIIEYLIFKKPIINVSSIEDDTSFNFLYDYGSIFNLRITTNSYSEEYLLSLCNFILSPPPVNENFINVKLQQHSLSSIVSKYQDLILK